MQQGRVFIVLFCFCFVFFRTAFFAYPFFCYGQHLVVFNQLIQCRQNISRTLMMMDNECNFFMKIFKKKLFIVVSEILLQTSTWRPCTVYPVTITHILTFAFCYCLYDWLFQMQSTLRDHKDNVGGIFNRYDILKVCDLLTSVLMFLKDIYHFSQNQP